MYTAHLTLTLAAASAALLGCAPTRSIASARAAERAPTFVTVQNDNWLDVTVYAVRGTERIRLGTVTGLSSATLRLPRDVSPDGTVRLLADPIGSPQRYLTDVIDVGPGQRIQLQVGSILSMSNFAVWGR